MFELNNLSPLTKSRKRVGRGGSRGGTSGRGHKGQNARSGGGVRAGFEGGQMPLSRRLPKRGFNNKRFAVVITVINLADLERHFEDGTTVDRAALVAKRLVKKASRIQVKVLGKGTLSKKLMVTANQFSASAQEAITKAGGVASLVGESNNGNAA